MNPSIFLTLVSRFSMISNLTLNRLLLLSNKSKNKFLNAGESVKALYTELNFLSSSVTSFIDDLSIINGDLKEASTSKLLSG